MTGSKDEHFSAVGFVGHEVEGFQAIIRAAKEKIDEIVGMTVNAVGDPPSTDAGRSSLELAVALRERLEEIIGISESLIVELSRYGGGF